MGRAVFATAFFASLIGASIAPAADRDIPVALLRAGSSAEFRAGDLRVSGISLGSLVPKKTAALFALAHSTREVTRQALRRADVEELTIVVEIRGESRSTDLHRRIYQLGQWLKSAEPGAEQAETRLER